MSEEAATFPSKQRKKAQRTRRAKNRVRALGDFPPSAPSPYYLPRPNPYYPQPAATQPHPPDTARAASHIQALPEVLPRGDSPRAYPCMCASPYSACTSLPACCMAGCLPPRVVCMPHALLQGPRQHESPATPCARTSLRRVLLRSLR